MTTLIERLRTFGGGVHRIEAADEIVRFQTSLIRLKMQIDQERELHAAELADMTAERDEFRDNSERLLSVANSAVQHQRDMVEAATEPLRAENAALRSQMERQKDEWLAWAEKRSALERDAERYRWLRRSQVALSLPAITVAALVADQSQLDAARDET